MSELATRFEPTPLARGLRPFAKALLLSLAAHAALVAVFWHVVSNPHEPAFPLVRVELAPTPKTETVVAPPPAAAAPSVKPAAPTPTHSVPAHTIARAPAPLAAPPPAAAAPQESVATSSTSDGVAVVEAASAANQPQAGTLPLDLRVLDWLAQYRAYPLAARRAHLEGVVQLRVTLLPDGRLVDARVAQSSGHSVLDQAALDLLAHAAPLPAAFGGTRTERIELELPIVYRMRSSSST
jgi:protein TonB